MLDGFLPKGYLIMKICRMEFSKSSSVIKASHTTQTFSIQPYLLLQEASPLKDILLSPATSSVKTTC